MKHFDNINKEFAKKAKDYWDDLSYFEQRHYIKTHPSTRKRLTVKPPFDEVFQEHVCPLCDSKFKDKESVATHIKATHSLGDASPETVQLYNNLKDIRKKSEDNAKAEIFLNVINPDDNTQNLSKEDHEQFKSAFTSAINSMNEPIMTTLFDSNEGPVLNYDNLKSKLKLSETFSDNDDLVNVASGTFESRPIVIVNSLISDENNLAEDQTLAIFFGPTEEEQSEFKENQQKRDEKIKVRLLKQEERKKLKEDNRKQRQEDRAKLPKSKRWPRLSDDERQFAGMYMALTNSGLSIEKKDQENLSKLLANGNWEQAKTTLASIVSTKYDTEEDLKQFRREVRHWRRAIKRQYRQDWEDIKTKEFGLNKT